MKGGEDELFSKSSIFTQNTRNPTLLPPLLQPYSWLVHITCFPSESTFPRTLASWHALGKLRKWSLWSYKKIQLIAEHWGKCQQPVQTKERREKPEYIQDVSLVKDSNKQNNLCYFGSLISLLFYIIFVTLAWCLMAFSGPEGFSSRAGEKEKQ